MSPLLFPTLCVKKKQQQQKTQNPTKPKQLKNINPIKKFLFFFSSFCCRIRNLLLLSYKRFCYICLVKPLYPSVQNHFYGSFVFFFYSFDYFVFLYRLRQTRKSIKKRWFLFLFLIFANN